MAKLPLMTYATAIVLLALDQGYRYGFDMIDATGLGSGTVYPVLRRLEDARLIKSKWEHLAVARSSSRPSRKYYALTSAADSAVEQARDRFPGLASSPLTERAFAL
jgi:DNA-binding PadR family transcriptional regulator